MNEEKNSTEVSYQAGNQFALKHKPEYDAQIYDHMASGHSFSSFQVKPQVFQNTIFSWRENVDSFRLAYERGVAEFLRRCETAMITEMFGLPLTENQKQWMPKVNHKLLRFVMSKRFKREYGVEPKIETDKETNKIVSITFVEYGKREPTKKDPITGAPIKPDVVVDAVEVPNKDE